ncbi:erythromycin esterase family protein [Pulveribacter suum]|uniref:Erythromycin esterase n=1 Tax=Pulveribacter suum TaxID=2116657 RepID=A0A2P1NKK1_9BURK|nr:erythromycin esterase family protein [Pulveribacter suum]AVP57589.1 erythromycin esterase [Pulveribacter suum]
MSLLDRQEHRTGGGAEGLQDDARLLHALRPHLRAFERADTAPGLLELIGDARFVLIGEASHGTHEFYLERARLTRRLITEHGCTAVVAEADWPDALRVDRYVRGRSDDVDAEAALAGFERFPTWMWRNTVMREFVEWLREHNRSAPASRQVGFFGMDLYSMYASIRAVVAHLQQVDPQAAARARARYGCLDHRGGEDSQAYGYAAAFGAVPSCEDQAIEQLLEMNRRTGATLGTDRDEAFYAQQNARLVRNAEEYYRTLFRGRVSSWNLRDTHMVQTLAALDKHLHTTRGAAPRMAVWAHNSHLGDASATEMGQQGEWNVGQLVRERWGRESVAIGLSTYHGSVTAASEWDGPAERKRVRDGLPGSFEQLFHDSGMARLWLPLRDQPQVAQLLQRERLQRAIGVIYQPDTERHSHYFHTRLPGQFDALLHIDRTHALQPLVPERRWHDGEGEVPETWPSGL